jgi:hypothetical protein
VGCIFNSIGLTREISCTAFLKNILLCYSYQGLLDTELKNCYTYVHILIHGVLHFIAHANFMFPNCIKLFIYYLEIIYYVKSEDVNVFKSKY